MARINQKRHRNLQLENGRLKERIAELERTLHQLREQKRSIISQLEQVELRNTERIKGLESESKAQKAVIIIDVQIFKAIKNEYPKCKDLQGKNIDREERVEQALKGGK